MRAGWSLSSSENELNIEAALRFEPGNPLSDLIAIGSIAPGLKKHRSRLRLTVLAPLKAAGLDLRCQREAAKILEHLDDALSDDDERADA